MTVIRPNSISGITSLTAYRGSIDFYAHDGSAATFNNINSNVTSGVFTGDLDVGGALTYEDVTNIDSVGVITARNGLHVTGGSVGIGTDNPSTTLHLSSATPIIKLQDSNSTGNAALQRIDAVHSGGTTQWFVGQNSTSTTELWIQNVSNDDIRFGTNNTERLRIKSNGEVRHQSTGGSTIYELKRTDTNTTGAVGTINFTASDAHSVASMSAMGDGDNEGAHIVFRTTSAAADNSPYNAATVERLRITSSGYVGIGEGAPGGRLTVKHANTATSGLNATLKLKQGVATNGNRSSLIFSSLDDFDVAAVNGVVEVHSGTSANNVGRLEFWTKASGSNAAERVRITSDGKMGVGCTPETDFQVRNANSGTLKIGGSGTGATGFQIQYNNSGNTTTEILTNYRATSGDASLKLDTGTFLVATGTSGTERLRIKSDGKIGINASSGWDNGTTMIVQANSGASAKSMVSLRGGSSGYVHSAIKLSATTDSNGSGGNQRGLGVFMHDESSSNEWYAGRPYSQSDYFLIARNTGVSAANAGGVTAQHSRRVWQVDAYGRTTQNGAIHTYQPGHSGGKSSRAFEAKGASGTYSSCVVDVSQHSYGSVAWDIKVGGYSAAHMHIAGTYYVNGNLFANYTSINNSANVSYTRVFTSNQTVRHTFAYTNGFVHPICEVTATCGGDAYLSPGDITITWS
jgi:hypothetical protein